MRADHRLVKGLVALVEHDGHNVVAEMAFARQLLLVTLGVGQERGDVIHDLESTVLRVVAVRASGVCLDVEAAAEVCPLLQTHPIAEPVEELEQCRTDLLCAEHGLLGHRSAARTGQHAKLEGALDGDLLLELEQVLAECRVVHPYQGALEGGQARTHGHQVAQVVVLAADGPHASGEAARTPVSHAGHEHAHVLVHEADDGLELLTTSAACAALDGEHHRTLVGLVSARMCNVVDVLAIVQIVVEEGVVHLVVLHHELVQRRVVLPLAAQLHGALPLQTGEVHQHRIVRIELSRVLRPAALRPRLGRPQVHQRLDLVRVEEAVLASAR
mmetsp:Transcript_16515/g.42280  ORF Transcript_16515/g.42280 Transcript_16515/m.42280 type:complete len:329 (+) Transcript_16515:1462-2448(+)